MENPLNNLITNITYYFVNCSPSEIVINYGKVSTLIKIHSEKLSQLGDVSFPCTSEIWLKYFPYVNDMFNEEAFQLGCDNVELVEREKQKLLNAAKEWLFPIRHIRIRQDRCQLHLQRNVIIQYLIPQVLQNPKYGILKKVAGKYVYLNSLGMQQSERQDLTFYRSQLLHSVLQKLLQYSSWHVLENKTNCSNENTTLELNVSSVVTKCSKNTCKGVTIKTGLVTDPANNGKLCQISTQEYLRYK